MYKYNYEKSINQIYYLRNLKNYNNKCTFNNNYNIFSLKNTILYSNINDDHHHKFSLKSYYSSNNDSFKLQGLQQHVNETSSATSFNKSTTSSLKYDTDYDFQHGNKLTFEHNIASGKTYEETYNNFKWTIPEHFNIGTDICDKHLKDKKDHKAIIYEDEHHNVHSVTFGELYEQSNQLANALKDFGIERGERVGVLLSQSIETALSHISVFRMGGISIPLFTLFGPDGLVYRLSNAEASCVLTDHDNLGKILSIKNSLPHLKKIIVFGKKNNINHQNDHQLLDQDFIVEWDKIKNKYSNHFKPVKTKADDPALIIFTSGTTGNPKGCLHAHRVLIGHLPGVQLPQNLFPQKDRELCFYTPADWAWIGGLIDVLLPSLYYGVTVLAHRAPKFDAKKIADLMDRHNVTTCFLPPTALKMMRQVHDLPINSKMVSIGSGGESLGDQLLDFGKRVFNVTINEFYGQTEANLLVGNCSVLMPVKNGSMGKPIPGHRVAIVNDDGEEVPQGIVGNIALETPDPVVFLQYWKNEKATQSKYKGKWLLTGDLGKVDREGYYWYVGRDDDIINSSGYRIGPSEIEHCLLRHPSVAMCGVIGVPDEIRGEVVKAYIVLKDAAKNDIKDNQQSFDHLKADIQKFVKDNLAAYEYPRLIDFIDTLPIGQTGKILRKDLREMHAKQIKK